MNSWGSGSSNPGPDPPYRNTNEQNSSWNSNNNRSSWQDQNPSKDNSANQGQFSRQSEQYDNAPSQSQWSQSSNYNQSTASNSYASSGQSSWEPQRGSSTDTDTNYVSHDTSNWNDGNFRPPQRQKQKSNESYDNQYSTSSNTQQSDYDGGNARYDQGRSNQRQQSGYEQEQSNHNDRSGNQSWNDQGQQSWNSRSESRDQSQRGSYEDRSGDSFNRQQRGGQQQNSWDNQQPGGQWDARGPQNTNDRGQNQNDGRGNNQQNDNSSWGDGRNASTNSPNRNQDRQSSWNNSDNSYSRGGQNPQRGDDRSNSWNRGEQNAPSERNPDSSWGVDRSRGHDQDPSGGRGNDSNSWGGNDRRRSNDSNSWGGGGSDNSRGGQSGNSWGGGGDSRDGRSGNQWGGQNDSRQNDDRGNRGRDSMGGGHDSGQHPGDGGRSNNSWDNSGGPGNSRENNGGGRGRNNNSWGGGDSGSSSGGSSNSWGGGGSGGGSGNSWGGGDSGSGGSSNSWGGGGSGGGSGNSWGGGDSGSGGSSNSWGGGGSGSGGSSNSWGGDSGSSGSSNSWGGGGSGGGSGNSWGGGDSGSGGSSNSWGGGGSGGSGNSWGGGGGSGNSWGNDSGGAVGWGNPTRAGSMDNSNLIGDLMDQPPPDDIEETKFLSIPFTPEVEARTDDEVDAYLADHEIRIIGPDTPKPFLTFDEMGLAPEFMSIIAGLEWIQPSLIQSVSIPLAFKGYDLVGVAKTGSGKTAAYVIPMILHMQLNGINKGPQALVIGPTRELVQQIGDVCRAFAPIINLKVAVLYGGKPRYQCIQELQQSPDVICASPGKLLDFIKATDDRRTDLSKVSFLVVDEADRLLDSGFQPQLRAIISRVQRKRQTLMWTATWPKEVREMVNDLMKDDHLTVVVGKSEITANPNIMQSFIPIESHHERFDTLLKVFNDIDNGQPFKVMIFANRRADVDDVVQGLSRYQYRCFGIHGDKPQMERNNAIEQFKNTPNSILVATDVVARGLDIPSVTHVVNYQMPHDLFDYVHRIGRTARAENHGDAISIFDKRSDAFLSHKIVKQLMSVKQEPPDWLVEIDNNTSRDEYKSHRQRFGR